MTSPIDPVQFGALQREVEMTRQDLAEIKADLRAISIDWHRAKGGTKVLFAISAVVGGLISMGLNYLLTKFG